MDHLWTPWRMAYVTSPKRDEGCVFCRKIEAGPDRDPENYVVYRGREAFVVLNIYPYSPGHLMILPYDHAHKLDELSRAARAEMMDLVSHFLQVLDRMMGPEGYNVGMNLGQVAGAGIDGHLHIHIVPRWAGDANFMTVVGETRMIPETLDDTYAKIVKLLAEYPPAG
ncbi:MAG: HIT domain-containing protein [Anaerolineae bacterium]